MSQTGSADDRLVVCHEPIPTHLRPVLIALLSGATDAAACRRLAVSGRTYSRRLAELLNYFESQTRFQAGVKFGLSGRTTFAAMPGAVHRDGVRGGPPVQGRWVSGTAMENPAVPH